MRDLLGRDNHGRVLKAKRLLESRCGLQSWIDVERILGSIKRTIAEGIDSSRSVVLFITKAYYDKVSRAPRT